MSESLLLNEFLQMPGVIFDVRSPGEFTQGRIPGALNLPLFSDAERASIGTAYKHQGKDQAVELGLQLVGPKMYDFVSIAKQHAPEGTAKVHCWRGGMRSAAMAWLLKFAGIRTVVLKGGYKVFRTWSLERFSQPYSFIVLGGMTGSGKTQVLESLQAAGEQVLNLESAANHRGSSYGMLGMPPQPSTEQFENEIAFRLAAFDQGRPIWIEDESRQIGTCHIPAALYKQMRQAPVIFMDVPLEERLQRLVKEYGNAPQEQLIAATQRISKHLGGLRTKQIIEAGQQNRLHDAISLVLQYYDAAYDYDLSRRRQQVTKITGQSLSPSSWASELRMLSSKQFQRGDAEPQSRGEVQDS